MRGIKAADVDGRLNEKWLPILINWFDFFLFIK
jgi:hypothetical protein